MTNSAELAGIARALVAGLGGIIVHKGWASAETVQAVGGAIVMAGVAWSSVRSKRKR